MGLLVTEDSEPTTLHPTNLVRLNCFHNKKHISSICPCKDIRLKTYGIVECGGILTRPIGNVTSPGYANGNYTNNDQCIWFFNNQNQTSSSIFIMFSNLRLETHSNCLFDFLEIKEGTYSKTNSVGYLLFDACK